MRVGVNCLFLIPDEVGGSEVYVRQLLAALAHVDSPPELVVFTNEENHGSFGALNQIRIPLPGRSRVRRVLAEQLSLGRAAREAHVDLLFSPGYTAPWRASCRQVVSILDVQYRAVPEGFGTAALWAQRLLVGMAAKRADVVVTLSEFSRSEIMKYLDVAAEKIVVTPLAAPAAFSRATPATRERPYLLSVSNTYPHKNYGRLVEAFASIQESIPHDLIIVGQPREGEPPRCDRVHRVHRLEEAELAGLVAGCDVFVFPSQYEGFGLPVLEALSAGTRVVAARAGAIPEIAGEAATYFDPLSATDIGRAIKEAITEETVARDERRQAGCERAARFSWESCAERTFGAFQKALT
jgi:glycosyltransferase involved in cell wall biosynthesis